MKNAAYDYTYVDDNIRYLKKWGAKHQLIVIIKRIMNTPKVSSLGAEMTVISEGV